jgi:hypothetical protein
MMLMQKQCNKPPSRCKPKPLSADLHNLSLGADLLTYAGVRLILGRFNVGVSVAAVLAEHAGLLREARNG